MVSFSKLVLGALAVIAGVAAQSTYPVTVSVPVEGVATPYDISFDLLAENSIVNAARQLCLQKAGEIGVTTTEVLNQVCIPRIEQHITAVLLANKIVERKAPTQVTMSIPFTDKGSYSISFDPNKSTALQLGEYLCTEKHVELGITTQEQLVSCTQGVGRFIEANYQAQSAPMKAAPVATSERKKDVRSITIPTDVGNLPLTLDINAVTANQAAEYVCREHATKIGITNVDGLNQCIPPISSYIQKAFGTQSRPPITMTMNANNLGEFEFTFDPTVPVNTVASDLCLLKAQDFGISTQQQLVENCIPSVAQYISATLSGRRA